MDDLRYPIGPFKYPESLTDTDRTACISRIAAAPAKLRAAVQGLSDGQLDTPYRPGGWTVRQVVHHVPDSHINAYTRFHLALTEPGPTIRPYDEKRWAELPDARSAPVDISLGLLEALHVRWVLLLRQLRADDWSRTYVHPEERRELTLSQLLGLYAWHGDHHVAHITGLRARMGWN
jgi:hypothetical protein